MAQTPAKASSVPGTEAARCDCGRTFHEQRTKACRRVRCLTYAMGCASRAGGCPGASPKLVAWIDAQRASGAPIPPIAPTAAGGRRAAEGQPSKRPAKKAAKVFTPEEARAALLRLNNEMVGEPTDRVKTIYTNAFNPAEFQLKLLDALSDPLDPTKRYERGSLDNDITMQTFRSIVGNTWAILERDKELQKRRFDNAVATVNASLDKMEKAMKEGKAATDVGNSGSYLLGKIEPYELVDIPLVERIKARNDALTAESDAIKREWGADGPAVLAAVRDSFPAWAAADAAPSTGAGRSKDSAAERINAYISDQRVFGPGGAVKMLLAGTLGDERGAQLAQNFSRVLSGLPSVDKALRAKLAIIYKTETAKKLKEVESVLVPIMEAIVAEAATNKEPLMYDLQEDGIRQRLLLAGQADRFSDNVLGEFFDKAVKKYLKEHPDVSKRGAWSSEDLKAAIDAIVKDIVEINPDRVAATSDEDLRASLSLEQYILIAVDNGVTAEQYSLDVLENGRQLDKIVKLVRKKLKANKGKRVPPEQADEVREKRSKAAKKSKEERRAEQQAARAQQARDEFARLKKFAVEVNTVWRPLMVGTRGDIFDALSKFYSPDAGEQPGAPRPSERANVLGAYEAVCKEGGTFADFVRQSGLVADTGLGTSVHRMAWTVLETDQRGADRRKRLVRSRFHEISSERLAQDYFGVGVEWPAHRKIAKSADLKKFLKAKKEAEEERKEGAPEARRLAEERATFIVQRILRRLYSALSTEAPFELNEYDAELRNQDGSTDDDDLPRGLVADLRTSVQRADELLASIARSDSDRKALASRAQGLAGLLHLEEVGKQILESVTKDAFGAYNPDSLVGIIMGYYAAIDTASQNDFIGKVFWEWSRTKSDATARADPGYATVYPPYLLTETAVGRRVVGIYRQIYDGLRKLDAKRRMPPAPKPHELQLAEERVRRLEAENNPRAPLPAQLRLDISDDDEDEEGWPTPASKTTARAPPAALAPPAPVVAADSDPEDMDFVPPALSGDESAGEEESEDVDQSDASSYVRDDFVVSDNEEDVGQSRGEPPESAFLANNPKGSAVGSTSVGFGTPGPVVAFKPAAAGGGSAAAGPAAAAPVAAAGGATPPPAAAAPKGSTVNLLVPRKKPSSAYLPVSTTSVDPFGPPAVSAAPVLMPAAAPLGFVLEGGGTEHL